MQAAPSEHVTLIVFIALYLAITLLIGWWAAQRVKTTKDFVIAGRSLPMFIAACALFATWFGSETVMGASAEFIAEEEGARFGLIRVIEDPFGAALCLVLVGAFFARPLYKLNILTFSDFFRLRYGRVTELFSALFMVPSFFGWVAAQLVAMAIILKVLGGVELPVGIAICTIIVVIYTYIGGMWAVSVTDFVQTIMIVAGLLLLAFQLSEQAGGISHVLSQQPAGFFNIKPDLDPIPFLEYIAAWITIGLGTIPGQDIFQRVMSAKSARTSVIASYVAGLMYLTIGMIPLFIALCGKMLYADMNAMAGTENEQLMLPQMVLHHGSIFIQIMFFGALLSAILSTASGAILAPATIIGENLVRPYLRNASDRRLLQIMRFSVVGVAVCAALMAGANTNIYELVGQSSSLSLVSLFVPLTAGIYWKRASNAGALMAIVGGMITWLLWEWQGNEVPSIIVAGMASLVAMMTGSYFWPDHSYQVFKTETEQSAA